MSDHANENTVESLSVLLASTYTLYIKTHNYHWNVTGPMFSTLHALFEMQYTELAAAVDEIAERIRVLGAYAPGSATAFTKLSAVQEENGQPTAIEMIQSLASDQSTIESVARNVIEAAEAIGDQPSTDLAIRRQEVHGKNGWMLKSHLIK